VPSAVIRFISTVCQCRRSHECRQLQWTGVVNSVGVVKSVVYSVMTALYVFFFFQIIGQLKALPMWERNTI